MTMLLYSVSSLLGTALLACVMTFTGAEMEHTVQKKVYPFGTWGWGPGGQRLPLMPIPPPSPRTPPATQQSALPPPSSRAQKFAPQSKYSPRMWDFLFMRPGKRRLDVSETNTIGSDPDNQSASKRDIFTSRGWGAGGILSSIIAPHEGIDRKPHPLPPGTSEIRVQHVSQVSNHDQPHSSPLIQHHHRSYNGIPQLFVSYGWGPLGR